MSEFSREALKKIGAFIPLGEKELLTFLAAFRPVYLRKGDYFLREGEFCKHLGLIVRGAMYCFFNRDGESIVEEFSLECDFITDYPGFLSGIPTDKNIKCIEDVELMVISRDELQELYRKNPLHEKIGRLVAEKLFVHWGQKVKWLKTQDAETRYLNLLRERPDLLQRVPQYLIASYLNVQPETLSRIRKRISEV